LEDNRSRKIETKKQKEKWNIGMENISRKIIGTNGREGEVESEKPNEQKDKKLRLEKVNDAMKNKE
jgi:hypothetical protein